MSSKRKNLDSMWEKPWHPWRLVSLEHLTEMSNFAFLDICSIPSPTLPLGRGVCRVRAEEPSLSEFLPMGQTSEGLLVFGIVVISPSTWRVLYGFCTQVISIIRFSNNPMMQTEQVLFPMKAIQAKVCLLAQPKSPSPVNNGGRAGLSLLTPTCCPLKGLLGKMAAFSCGVKTSSRTMWGIIVLIFSFTYLLYFMFSSSLLSPGTWDLTRVFEVLVTGTLEGLGPGTVILVPLLPLNASPLRTYPKKCCWHLASFSASLLLLGSHYRQYLAPTSGLIGKWDFCHPGFLVLDNSSPSH